jgi:hypothetical protein
MHFSCLSRMRLKTPTSTAKQGSPASRAPHCIQGRGINSLL